jgi:hypothetical protein
MALVITPATYLTHRAAYLDDSSQRSSDDGLALVRRLLAATCNGSHSSSTTNSHSTSIEVNENELSCSIPSSAVSNMNPQYGDIYGEVRRVGAEGISWICSSRLLWTLLSKQYRLFLTTLLSEVTQFKFSQQCTKSVTAPQTGNPRVRGYLICPCQFLCVCVRCVCGFGSCVVLWPGTGFGVLTVRSPGTLGSGAACHRESLLIL